MAETKTETTKISKDKNLFEIIAIIRSVVADMNLKKSGHNGFQNFDYYEQKDFLPIVNKLCAEYGICPMFNIITDPNGIEIARLDIVKGAERVSFQVPTAEPSGNNAIQSLGAKITYLKRYLYLNFLELTENDIVDAHDNSKDVRVEPKATPNQVKIIREKYDEENIAKMLEYYNIKSLEELNAKDASVIISRKGK